MTSDPLPPGVDAGVPPRGVPAHSAETPGGGGPASATADVRDAEVATSAPGPGTPDRSGRTVVARGPRSDFRANRRRVLNTLLQNGPITRAQICSETGLSRATVSALMTRFLKEETVVERDIGHAPSRAGGRPPMLVRLSPHAGVVVGVGPDDTGGIVVSVASLGHDILHQRSVDLGTASTPTPARVAKAADAIKAAVAATGYRFDDVVVGVAIGVAGPVTGPVERLPEFGITELNLPAPAETLSLRLGVPVVQENDANLGAMAEHEWGAGRDTDALLYLRTGRGVGAGLILDRDLYKGAWGTAGEIGHTTVLRDGELCRCGNRGCLDTLVGGAYVVPRLQAAGVPVGSLSEVVRRAVLGEAACREAVDRSATEIGVVLAGTVNLLNPERVVVGGPYAGDPRFIALLSETVQAHAMRSSLSQLAIVPGELGPSATALGGVSYLIHQPSRSGVAARIRSLAA